MELYFGALSSPINEQLINQNIFCEEKLVSRFQEFADAITTLHLSGVASESEVHKMRTRLMKHISKTLAP